MTQYLHVSATGIFQFGSYFWHPIKRTAIVDCLGQRDYARRQPRLVNGQSLEGIAEDFPDQLCLGKKFLSLIAVRGSTRLGAPSGISGGNRWTGRRSVPRCLASGPLTGKPGCTDRKSTRLNSSHSS